MIEIFGRNWGIVLIRGIVSLMSGIYIIVGHPAVGLATWILVYGVFLVVTGVFVWINSFLTRRYEPSWLEFILNGPLRVAIGIVTLAWPAVDRSMDASTVLHIVGAWSVFRGVGHIVSGVQLRRLLRGAWLLHVAGITSVAFGILLYSLVDQELSEIFVWIGGCLTFFGIVWIAFALVLRRWLHENRAELDVRLAHE